MSFPCPWHTPETVFASKSESESEYELGPHVPRLDRKRCRCHLPGAQALGTDGTYCIALLLLSLLLLLT